MASHGKCVFCNSHICLQHVHMISNLSSTSSSSRFARIRLSLRFELLCLDSSLDVPDADKEDLCPSVGLRKIQKLSQLGAHEDQTKQGVKNSISTPDLLGYFWNDIH